MTAQLHILPVIPRINPHDPAWREQRGRELMAAAVNDCSQPPRTRPLLVIDNAARSDAAAFADAVFASADQLLRERAVATALNNIPFD